MWLMWIVKALKIRLNTEYKNRQSWVYFGHGAAETDIKTTAFRLYTWWDPTKKCTYVIYNH